MAAAFFYSIFQVKRYRNNDFSSFWQAVGFGGCLVSIENFNYFSSFWQDLGSGGCFFLLTFHLKKYCKMTCSSFWQAVGFGGCFFLLQVLKNWLVQLLAGSWQMGFNCNFWLKLFYLLFPSIFLDYKIPENYAKRTFYLEIFAFLSII